MLYFGFVKNGRHLEAIEVAFEKAMNGGDVGSDCNAKVWGGGVQGKMIAADLPCFG